MSQFAATGTTHIPHMAAPLARRATVDVWLARVCAHCRVSDAEAGWLDPAERARAAGFLRQDDRRLYELAHVLLRKVLGGALGLPPDAVRMRAGGIGKPELAEHDPARARLSFSLSHTGGCVACAISRDCEVGVDVERVRDLRIDDALTQFALHPLEVAQLRGAAQTERGALFYRLWTAKEALLKALGAGLSIAPGRLGFVLSEDAATLREHPFACLEGEAPYVRAVRLHAAGHDAPDLAFSVAALSRTAALSVREIHAASGCARLPAPQTEESRHGRRRAFA